MDLVARFAGMEISDLPSPHIGSSQCNTQLYTLLDGSSESPDIRRDIDDGDRNKRHHGYTPSESSSFNLIHTFPEPDIAMPCRDYDELVPTLSLSSDNFVSSETCNGITHFYDYNMVATVLPIASESYHGALPK